MTDLFISYQRAERDAVQIIANKLAELGVEVWFDTKLRAGGSFDEEIAGALRNAKAVLTCWTPAAIASEWVRGEATMAHQNGTLIACFLEPTDLIPPFNLTHAEDLSAWAGQDDDPAWIKLLERIGELTGRPGLSGYMTVMRPVAPAKELRAWAEANGSDRLANTVWARITAIEGEDGRARIEREKREAKARSAKRRAQEERSRQLIRERGLRDPKRERRRQLAMVAAIVVIAIGAGGGLYYVSTEQGLETRLRDELTKPADVQAFKSANWWRPVAKKAEAKLAALSEAVLTEAQSTGTIESLQSFLDTTKSWATEDARVRAQTALEDAKKIKAVQDNLLRMRSFDGVPNGAMDELTREAIKRFRHRWMLPEGDAIDNALLARIDKALDLWVHPKLEDLYARRLGSPTRAEYEQVARRLSIEIETLGAVADVEAGPGRVGFEPDGRPLIAFYPHVFSRLTKRAYDSSHPAISSVRYDPQKLSGAQAAHWRRLEEAYALAPNEALMATAWGKYQVLGQMYKTSGVATVGEFVRLMAYSESSQLEAHLALIRANRLEDELATRNWAAFARVYNGSGYAQNQYDKRLAQAFERRKANQPELELEGDRFLFDDAQRDDYDRRIRQWLETGKPTPAATPATSEAP